MGKYSRNTSIFAAAAAAAVTPALGQSAPSSAPVVPSIAVAEKDLGAERKYWILHKPGVTTEQAASDLGFCWRFLARGEFRAIPGFVPWGRSDGVRKAPYAIGPYGFVGDVIGVMLAGPLDRSKRQSLMFRCMVPRGYDRYRTSEALWKQLNDGEAAQAIPILALIASGPVPPTPKVLP